MPNKAGATLLAFEIFLFMRRFSTAILSTTRLSCSARNIFDDGLHVDGRGLIPSGEHNLMFIRYLTIRNNVDIMTWRICEISLSFVTSAELQMLFRLACRHCSAVHRIGDHGDTEQYLDPFCRSLVAVGSHSVKTTWFSG